MVKRTLFETNIELMLISHSQLNEPIITDISSWYSEKLLTAWVGRIIVWMALIKNTFPLIEVSGRPLYIFGFRIS